MGRNPLNVMAILVTLTVASGPIPLGTIKGDPSKDADVAQMLDQAHDVAEHVHTAANGTVSVAWHWEGADPEEGREFSDSNGVLTLGHISAAIATARKIIRDSRADLTPDEAEAVATQEEVPA